MTRRNNLDITADILRVAKTGAKKTQIVYQANLNFRIVKGYLKGLIESGLLLHDPPKYYATPKGITYLTKFDNLVSFRETVVCPLDPRMIDA